MARSITKGISVSVETFYQHAQSNPVNSEYLFAYRITIENTSSLSVKLLSRHWHITDSNGAYRQVKGDGVVGLQPTIHPHGSYQYTSSCVLHTEIGKMWGSYLMEDLDNGGIFQVSIPEFQMIAPFKAN